MRFFYRSDLFFAITLTNMKTRLISLFLLVVVLCTCSKSQQSSPYLLAMNNAKSIVGAYAGYVISISDSLYIDTVYVTSVNDSTFITKLNNPHFSFNYTTQYRTSNAYMYSGTGGYCSYFDTLAYMSARDSIRISERSICHNGMGNPNWDEGTCYFSGIKIK